MYQGANYHTYKKIKLSNISNYLILCNKHIINSYLIFYYILNIIYIRNRSVKYQYYNHETSRKEFT